MLGFSLCSAFSLDQLPFLQITANELKQERNKSSSIPGGATCHRLQSSPVPFRWSWVNCGTGYGGTEFQSHLPEQLYPLDLSQPACCISSKVQIFILISCGRLVFPTMSLAWSTVPGPHLGLKVPFMNGSVSECWVCWTWSRVPEDFNPEQCISSGVIPLGTRAVFEDIWCCKNSVCVCVCVCVCVYVYVY